jgi:hypothetical protein
VLRPGVTVARRLRPFLFLPLFLFTELPSRGLLGNLRLPV